jgi:anti-sigma factor RsiW
MNEHVGDDAELYPLGILDDDAAREVERHIATCTLCAERLAEAQLVAASLASALPAVAPSPALERRVREAARPRPLLAGPATNRNVWGLALAAVFALAFLALGWKAVALRGELAADDLALVTVVHSHFNHVSMTPQSTHPVVAKVLYARDGSWLYVIADKPGGTLHAIARAATGTFDLGVTAGSGQTATLLVRPSARVQSLVLQREGTTVASATLIYGAPPVRRVGPEPHR